MVIAGRGAVPRTAVDALVGLRFECRTWGSARTGGVRPTLKLLGRHVPVLGDLAVVDAEHIEPGGSVLFALVLWVRHLAHER